MPTCLFHDLRDYRTFLNGSGAFAAKDWSSLFDTYSTFNQDIVRATSIKGGFSHLDEWLQYL